MKAIYLDMDGTCADLYGVPNWLAKLHSEDVTPYEQAEPMYDMDILNSLLEKFKRIGITIGVISWCAMGSTKEYDTKVRKAKRDWIKKHLPAVSEIHITRYGYSKKKSAKIKDSILVDDNEQVRESWKGRTIDANKDLIAELTSLAKEMQIA